MDEKGRLLYVSTNWNSVMNSILMLILYFFLFVQGVRVALASFIIWNNNILGILFSAVVFYVIISTPWIMINLFTAKTKIYENGIQHHNPLGKKKNFFQKYIIITQRYFHYFKDMDSIYISSANPRKKPRLIITNQYGTHTIAIGEKAEEIYEKLKPAFDRYKEGEAILTGQSNNTIE
ncbi:MAG: hypothetical protein JSW00_05890 [Thermoplasmata archaeon]|nr:MAG: hypothetical protein JSW00_05890 [Thermoplasmata archaeon]